MSEADHPAGAPAPDPGRTAFGGRPAEGTASASGAAFHSDDLDNQVEYRAISGLAIVALLLGIASATALATTLLWVIPLVGAVASIAAVVRIDRSGGSLAGRGAALCGLALCILFGVAAPTRFVSTSRLLAGRAERVALQWFAALASDEPQVAQQLSSAGALRARAPPVPTSFGPIIAETPTGGANSNDLSANG